MKGWPSGYPRMREARDKREKASTKPSHHQFVLLQLSFRAHAMTRHAL
jgi:hypothetical protein